MTDPSHDATAASCGVPPSAVPLHDSFCQGSFLVHSTTQQRIALDASTVQSAENTASSTTSTGSSHPQRRVCLLVGRQKEADIRIQHGSISRQHAVFFYLNKNQNDSGLFIMDLGGKHGTSINGRKIRSNQHVPLQQGDSILFGKVRESVFTVELPKKNVTKSTESPATETKPTEQHETATTTNTSTTTTTVDHDQQAMQEAGKGLTGRAKRQAEIEAMMVSLDQDITYTKASQSIPDDETEAHPTATTPNDNTNATTTTNNENSAQSKIPKQHASLPISGTWEIPPESSEGGGRLTCVAVDPPGSRVAVGRRDATMSLFDFAGMNEVRRQAFTTIQPQSEGLYPLQSLAYSPTGDKILVGSASVQPVVLDREGQFLLQFARGDMYLRDPSKTIGHTAEVTAVAWHPLEKSLVFTASRDGSVRRWNVETGKLQFEKLCSEHVWAVKSAAGHKTAVTSLAVHPSGRSFAVGTQDGSLQLWSTNRTRADKVVVAGKAAVTALCFTVDGKRLASRAADESVAKVWNVTALRSSAQPAFTCLGLPTVHETANLAFSPDGKYIVAGATAVLPLKPGAKPTERGSLNFYHVMEGEKDEGESKSIEPCVALEISGSAGPVTVHWHARWNQVTVGCSNGAVRVYYNAQAKDTSGGVHLSLRQSTRLKKRSSDDGEDLQSILNARAKQAGPVLMGEILTPLASQPLSKRRKRQEEEEAAVAKREPERPASGKHKAGGAGSAVTTFAQYVADQSGHAKDIAGKDPREALLKYTKGKSYLGKETKILDTKTMEEEQEEQQK